MWRTLIQTTAPRAVVLIRLLIGAVFLSEGVQKFLFPDQLGVGRFLKIGLPMPEVLGPFVGTFEIVCGSLVLLGLLTRLAVIPLLAIMARLVGRGNSSKVSRGESRRATPPLPAQVVCNRWPHRSAGVPTTVEALDQLRPAGRRAFRDNRGDSLARPATQRTRTAKPMMIRAPEIASAAPTRSVRVGDCPSISQSQTSDAAM
jgi:DoxX